MNDPKRHLAIIGGLGLGLLLAPATLALGQTKTHTHGKSSAHTGTAHVHSLVAPKTTGGTVGSSATSNPGVTTHASGTAGTTTHTPTPGVTVTTTAGTHAHITTGGITSGTSVDTHTPTAGSAGHAGTGSAVMALHKAHMLLSRANHDYDGHRARAAEHVSLAIHELSGHHHAGQHPGAGPTAGGVGNQTTAGTGTSTAVTHHTAAAAHHTATGTTTAGGFGRHTSAVGAVGGTAHHEPQAESDAQLHQALKVLNLVHGKMPGHPNAAEHVGVAIHEIHRALEVR
jgi:hypothetical protein